MNRTLALAATLALAPVLATAQEVPVPISDINVTVELKAVESNALDRWPQIGADLNEAIRVAAAPHLANDGVSVAVVLNEVSLGGVQALADDGEFNRLGGWVYVRDDMAAPPILSREIVLESAAFVPGGTSEYYIIPSRPEFYNALVNVFAARVIEEVDSVR